jgi:hypothetical protein
LTNKLSQLVCFSKIKHALSHPETILEEDLPVFEHDSGMLYLDWFMTTRLPSEICRWRLDENMATSDDALQFTSDALEKFQLYVAHRVRVVNQQQKISQLEEQMKQECLHDQQDSKWCIVVIDWKMKFEPKFHR